ncbi:hypothetical protein FRB94_013614 [Tulasnella sp. JGI-2019a]|nr:hypothetical protein FRB93_007633 [Tulasnella sp. JGI-2019a]KAG9008254.1 hypothetical protein FRB94_013614 [Tulasnella sp. JGI-2019a]KAG9023750.1 hypothetical protein FRB95_012554 [Tulasnella sp. JGI-2019a]
MENPHEEKQAVYLERIIKNTDKCIEAICELNASIEAICLTGQDVIIASDLWDNYRRNVEFNLKQKLSLAGPVFLEPPESTTTTPDSKETL